MKTQYTRILGLSVLWTWGLLMSPLAYGQLTKTREESAQQQTTPQKFEFQKPIAAARYQLQEKLETQQSFVESAESIFK